MIARDFTENRIRQLVQLFPNIKCSYKFEDFSNTHFIEVVPNAVYDTSVEYAKAEERFISDFFDLNIPESICFITDTSLVKMVDPSLVVQGNSESL